MIKVLIVDDHIVLTRGVENILKEDKIMKVVGAVHDGNQAIDFIRKHPNTDIILMDINMPNLDGIEATKIISKEFTHPKVIMLTLHNNDSTIRKSFFAGAKGFLSKNSPIENVFSAIKIVNEGKTYICPTIAHSLIKTPLIALEDQQSNNNTQSFFSNRENEILNLIFQGKTSKEISDELLVSTRTIDVHRHNIMKKTQTTSTVELLIYAIKNGLYKIE